MCEGKASGTGKVCLRVDPFSLSLLSIFLVLVLEYNNPMGVLLPVADEPGLKLSSFAGALWPGLTPSTL